MVRVLKLWIPIAFLITGCQLGEKECVINNYEDESNLANPFQAKDSYSYAQPNEAVIQHLDLDIEVSFRDKKITGKATFQIDNKTGADKIYFDTNNKL